MVYTVCFVGKHSSFSVVWYILYALWASIHHSWKIFFISCVGSPAFLKKIGYCYMIYPKSHHTNKNYGDYVFYFLLSN